MATGLNFQTQTIINSNLDPDSSKLNGKGVDNTYLFKSGKTNIDGVEVDALKIKRDFVFVKSGVKAIRKRAGYNAVMCKATIDFADPALLAALKAGGAKTYCRLDIYLGVEGAEPYIYSTPWVQKGMPFWVEFTVKGKKNKDSLDEGDTAQVIAQNVADILKKNHVFLCDKDLINVSVSGSKLILEGATEYQRFRKIEISTFDAYDDYAEKVAELDPAKEATDIKLDARGKNSFGTYSQLIKDLRLPTAANYQWTHIRQAETPIVGAIYNQYIIEYEAPATNDGLHAVGQRMTSRTTHVFWVKNDSDLISAWEAALGTVGTVVDVASTLTQNAPGEGSGNEESGGSKDPL